MSKKPYSRVYVEITNLCNMSCSFCHGTSRKPKSMTMEEFAHVCKSIRHLTDYVYFHVMGEPLTHPLLPEFIRYATSLGFKCAVTTNGTLLDRRGEELIGSGVYKVNLSVHSFESGGEEEHIAYLTSLANFALAASESGVLTVLRLWNRGVDEERNDRALEVFRRELDGEWLWGARGARIRHKLHLEYGERFEWPDINLPEGDTGVFCYGLSDHFGILSDGSVIPCCLDSDGVITLGNVFEAPMDDILNSPRAEAMRCGFATRKVTEPLCRRCGYARRF